MEHGRAIQWPLRRWRTGRDAALGITGFGALVTISEPKDIEAQILEKNGIEFVLLLVIGQRLLIPGNGCTEPFQGLMRDRCVDRDDAVDRRGDCTTRPVTAIRTTHPVVFRGWVGGAATDGAGGPDGEEWWKRRQAVSSWVHGPLARWTA